MTNRLLIRTKERNQAHSQVWQSDTPMPIGHPARWVLTRAEAGVRILDLRGKGGEVEQGRVHFISAEEIRQRGIEKKFRDGNEEISISIQECSPVRAAYFTDDRLGQPGIEEAKLWAYAGVKRTISSSTPVHGAYIGYYELRPRFIVYRKQDMIQIKCLSRGLVIKEKGKQSEVLPMGSVTEFKLNLGHHLTLKKRLHWWKFQVVREPSKGIAQISSTKILSAEDSFWKKSLFLALGLIAISVASLYLFVPKKEVPLPAPEPQIVKVLPRKARASHTSANASADQPAQQEAKKQATAPKNTESETAAAAAAAASASSISSAQSAATASPADGASSGTPTPAAAASRPVLSQRQKANREASSKAEMIRKAFSGSRLLAVPLSATAEHQSSNNKTSDTSAANSASSTNEVAHSLAMPNNSSITPTVVSNGVEVKQGALIESLGSKTSSNSSGAGFGYNASESAAAWVGGTGKSFMNISGGGSAVEEGLSREEVARVIMAHMGEVRYCHEAALLRNPKCAGKIVLHFVIGKTGAVKKSEEESSTMSDQALSSCILRRLGSWSFPKPRGGVDVSVSFPFLFKVLDEQ